MKWIWKNERKNKFNRKNIYEWLIVDAFAFGTITPFELKNSWLLLTLFHYAKTFLLLGYNSISVTILSLVFELFPSFYFSFFFCFLAFFLVSPPSSDPSSEKNLEWIFIIKSLGWMCGLRLPIDRNPLLFFSFKILSTYEGKSSNWHMLMIDLTPTVTPATIKRTR